MTSVNQGSLFSALIPQTELGQSLFHQLPLGGEIIWEEVLGPRHSQASRLLEESLVQFALFQWEIPLELLLISWAAPEYLQEG